MSQKCDDLIWYTGLPLNIADIGTHIGHTNQLRVLHASWH